MYAGCPILWTSRVQSEVALSTTESEYIAISSATREVLPLIELMGKLEKKGIIERSVKPVMRCRVFEDNSGAVELATSVKISENATKNQAHKYEVSPFQATSTRGTNCDRSNRNGRHVGGHTDESGQ